MTEESTKKFTIESQEEVGAFLEKLAATGRSKAVFGEPVQAGVYTIITAAEVGTGGGAGFGGGGGKGPSGEEGEGSGGGGGGVSFGRPVASIIVGPDSVRVEPIIDVTKIAITFLSAAAAVFLSDRRIKKFARGLRR